VSFAIGWAPGGRLILPPQTFACAHVSRQIIQ
jgi:hypothetical protein